ncbi:MAG: hypothetical protein OJF51_000689 [Nitrospira sp.]|nr:MAG: hypothetical protein OJF51_000689 [Nitrospira sp.]
MGGGDGTGAGGNGSGLGVGTGGIGCGGKGSTDEDEVPDTFVHWIEALGISPLVTVISIMNPARLFSIVPR